MELLNYLPLVEEVNSDTQLTLQILNVASVVLVAASAGITNIVYN